MKNNYKRIVYYSTSHSCWVVEVHELPGCIADGSSVEEAMANVEIITQEWIDVSLSLGKPIPKPKQKYNRRILMDNAYTFDENIFKELTSIYADISEISDPETKVKGETLLYDTINEVVKYSNIARIEGLISLEEYGVAYREKPDAISDLKASILFMIADGADPDKL